MCFHISPASKRFWEKFHAKAEKKINCSGNIQDFCGEKRNCNVVSMSHPWIYYNWTSENYFCRSWWGWTANKKKQLCHSVLRRQMGWGVPTPLLLDLISHQNKWERDPPVRTQKYFELCSTNLDTVLMNFLAINQQLQSKRDFAELNVQVILPRWPFHQTPATSSIPLSPWDSFTGLGQSCSTSENRNASPWAKFILALHSRHTNQPLQARGMYGNSCICGH